MGELPSNQKKHLRENRRFRRWEVLIPCQVELEGEKIPGLIQNLSLGGALITQVSSVPRAGERVVIHFELDSRITSIRACLTSRVVHTSPEVARLGQVGWFGVEFEGPEEEMDEKLVPLLNSISAGTFS